MLLSAWAAKVGMLLPASGPQVAHGWSNLEIGYEVRDGDNGYLVVKTDRGTISTWGRFDALVDADKFLLMCLGSIWRADHNVGDVFPVGAADGWTASPEIDGWSVVVSERRAVFADQFHADRYTHLMGMNLAEVAALMAS